MDILMLEGDINYKNIANYNNRKIIELYIKKNENKLVNDELKMIIDLINFDKLEKINLEKYIVLFAKKVNNILWKS